MDYLKFISTRLRTLRENSKYSLEKLASLASQNGNAVTKDLIHNIEKCRVNTFDPNVLAAIAKVFNLSLSEFIKLPNDVDVSSIDATQLARLLGALKNVSGSHAEIAVDTAISLLNRLSTEAVPKKELSIISKKNYKGDIKKLVPYYELRVAAGLFDEKVEEVQPLGFVVVDRINNNNKEYFVTKIFGKSMEPLIPDSSFCLFKKYTGGSRQDKIMLVRVAGFTDPENGAAYVIKKYKRIQNIDDNQDRSNIEIHLLSENKNFTPIILKNLSDYEISTPCEFIKVL